MYQAKRQVIADMASHVSWYPIMFFLFFLCMVVKLGANFRCFRIDNDGDAHRCFRGMAVFHLMFAVQPLIFCFVYLLSNPDEYWRIKMAFSKRYIRKSSSRRRSKSVRFSSTSEVFVLPPDQDSRGAFTYDEESGFELLSSESDQSFDKPNVIERSFAPIPYESL